MASPLNQIDPSDTTPTHCGTFALPLKLKQLESSEYLRPTFYEKATHQTTIKWLVGILL